MPALAGPLPLMIFGPGHYLKQFHKNYQDDFRLSALMKQNRVKKWADLHIKMSRASRPENPDLPSLDPWVNTTPPPAEQFVFVRNPFFHRIDENGVQLPYIDRFILNVSSSSIIAAKAGAGESDLQATAYRFQRLHLSEGCREALSGEGQSVETGARLARRAAAESQLRRRGLAQAVPGNPLPARAVAGRRSA
jgi:ABC-type transport system substrate-binding protein